MNIIKSFFSSKYFQMTFGYIGLLGIIQKLSHLGIKLFEGKMKLHKILPSVNRANLAVLHFLSDYSKLKEVSEILIQKGFKLNIVCRKEAELRLKVLTKILVGNHLDADAKIDIITYTQEDVLNCESGIKNLLADAGLNKATLFVHCQNSASEVKLVKNFNKTNVFRDKGKGYILAPKTIKKDKALSDFYTSFYKIIERESVNKIDILFS